MNSQDVSRYPSLIYSREECDDPRALPGSSRHTILLPLQVELKSKGARLLVEKIYYVGTDFLIFSKVQSCPSKEWGYCIPETRFKIPHFVDFNLKKSRSIHFVECDSNHQFIPTNEPFITRQVKDINEFWKYLFGLMQDPDYLDEVEKVPEEKEEIERADSPGPPKTWRRFIPTVNIPYLSTKRP